MYCVSKFAGSGQTKRKFRKAFRETREEAFSPV